MASVAFCPQFDNNNATEHKNNCQQKKRKKGKQNKEYKGKQNRTNATPECNFPSKYLQIRAGQMSPLKAAMTKLAIDYDREKETRQWKKSRNFGSCVLLQPDNDHNESSNDISWLGGWLAAGLVLADGETFDSRLATPAVPDPGTGY